MSNEHLYKWYSHVKLEIYMIVYENENVLYAISKYYEGE